MRRIVTGGISRGSDESGLLHCELGNIDFGSYSEAAAISVIGTVMMVSPNSSPFSVPESVAKRGDLQRNDQRRHCL